MRDLLLRKYFRKGMFFAGKKLGWKYVRLTKYMLIEEAEALGCNTTLRSTKTQCRLEIVDVKNDVILRYRKWIDIIEVGEEEPQFRGIISNRTFRITTRTKRIRKFDEQCLRRSAWLLNLEIVFLTTIVKFIIVLKDNTRNGTSPKVSVQQ